MERNVGMNSTMLPSEAKVDEAYELAISAAHELAEEETYERENRIWQLRCLCGEEFNSSALSRPMFQCRCGSRSFRILGIPITEEPCVTDQRLSMTEEMDSARNPEKANPVRDTVDKAIDVLKQRVVGEPDRGRLRKALDAADAPLPGRAGADEALSGAIGRSRR